MADQVYHFSPARVPLELWYATPAPLAIYLFFGWVMVCLATYALIAKPPPEPSRFSSEEYDGPLGPMSRALHLTVGMVILSLMETRASGVGAGRVCLLLLPLFWASGTAPATHVLLDWAMEQSLVHLHGGSPAANRMRLYISLALTWLCLLLAVAMEYLLDVWGAILVGALAGFVLSHDVLPTWTAGTHHNGGQLFQFRDARSVPTNPDKIPYPELKELMGFTGQASAKYHRLGQTNAEVFVRLVIFGLLCVFMRLGIVGLLCFIPVFRLGQPFIKYEVLFRTILEPFITYEVLFRTILELVIVVSCGLVWTAITFSQPYYFVFFANPKRKWTGSTGISMPGRKVAWLASWAGRVGIILYIYSLGLYRLSCAHK
ncbi:hypothetical protein T484DRAFT_1766570 [Baffinella frigidus]|nr:hypothetical protein T484DRAFT_1766570 [Cryptophyta sp. CCMP2293]